MQIAEDLPSKSQIFEYWKGRLRGLGICIHWDRPACWACGFHYGTKYDFKRSHTRWSDVLNCWDEIPLQRCHIVPRSLGGRSEVANLFLMCRECHDLTPNTNIPEIFFEWAGAQDSSAREDAIIRTALNSFGVDAAEAVDVCRLLASDDFRSWRSDKTGLHRPQSNYAPIHYRLTTSTMIGLAVYYQRVVRNGSTIRRPSSSVIPCCMSSDHSVSQPA
jgi:HNH endonuclease